MTPEQKAAQSQQIPEWAWSLMQGHMTEDEEIIDFYVGRKVVYAVSNLRLFEVSKKGSKFEAVVDSTDLTGQHIVGSSVGTEKTYGAVVTGIIIAGLGVSGFNNTNQIFWLVGGLIIGAVLLLYGIDTKTYIKIQTYGEPEKIEIPDDARFLGESVSRVITQNMD